MIGKKISPILVDIETTLWEHELNVGIKPEYSIEGFRAASKIFMSTLLDKMWELQQNENIEQKDRENMAEKAGEEFRDFIKRYTDIDTHSLY